MVTEGANARMGRMRKGLGETSGQLGFSPLGIAKTLQPLELGNDLKVVLLNFRINWVDREG